MLETVPEKGENWIDR